MNSKPEKRTPSPKNAGDQNGIYADSFLKNPIPMVIIRPSDVHCVDINESFTNLTGYRRNDLIEKSLTSIGLIDDAQTGILLRKLKNKRQDDHPALSFKSKAGEFKHGIFNTAKIKSAGQDYLLITIIGIADLTKTGNRLLQDERKPLEGARRYTTNHDRFHQLTENAKDVVYRMSLPDGQYEYINPASTEITGYTPEEHYLNPLLVQDLIHPDYENYFHEQWKNLADGNPPPFYEYKIIHKSGSERWLHQKNVLIRDEGGSPVAIEGIIRDVTEQKRMEEALRESESKYRIVADNTYNWEFWLNPDGHFIYSSPSCSRITGYDSIEFLRDASLMKKILHPEDQHLFQEHRTSVLKEKTPKGIEFRIIHQDGSVRWIGHVCQPVFDQNGHFIGTRGSNRDITAQKNFENGIRNIEADLRESEDRFRTLAENAPIAIILIEPDQKIYYANPSYTKIFGYTLEDTPDCATAFKKFFPDPEYRKKIIAGWNIARNQENWNVKSVRTSKAQCKDGTCKTVQTICNVLADGKCLLLFLDVTDFDNMQRMLERNRKLESIGTLAGGIAHDFNNLLATILGYIQLAKTDDQAKKSTIKQLLAAEWALHQSAELTHRLITFAKGGEPLKKSCDLRELLKDELYKKKLDAQVNKNVQIDQDLEPIFADEAQIRQVIKNLITNAIEAMKDGGTLTVGANNIAIKTEDRLPLKDGFYVRIYVKDTGKGISPKNLPLIFDPYFTTKGRGAQKGMGLGLSVANSIVSKHDGYITVESVEGKGTSFYVYLPSSAKNVGVDLSLNDPDNRRGRVLIMDDDPLFVEALEDMVDALGCEVTVANDGFKAVDLYEEAEGQPGQHFDLVILDLTIKGGLGGKLTMERLQAIDPDVKAVICSGYSNDSIMHNYEQYGFMGAMPKPFDIKILKAFIDKATMKR